MKEVLVLESFAQGTNAFGITLAGAHITQGSGCVHDLHDGQWRMKLHAEKLSEQTLDGMG